ncbi:MAG TPA: hypothetical protein VJR71_03935 [Pseudolabrys sp.]|nr:hypothetical protein [Pseudolabrys sp.]
MSRPQYFWVLPSQQPVFMQYARREPQFVTHVDIDARFGLLLQLVMQAACSLLQRIGVPRAGPA